MQNEMIRDADDYNATGEMKYYQKDYQGAVIDFTKALEIESEDPEIFFNRGLAKLMNNQKNEAFMDFLKVMELGDRVSYKLMELCN